MGVGKSRPKILPEATGPFGVGCADIMTDSEPNGLFARIFYPTEKVTLQDKVDQLPLWIPRHEYIDGFADYTRRNIRQMRWLFSWLVGDTRIGALWHQPVASEQWWQGKFPVIIFTHGMAGNRFVYSTYCCNLASHGFVVAAIEHRDRSASWTYTLKKENETEEIPLTYQHPKPGQREFNFRNPQLNKRVAECIRLFHLLEEINLAHCKTTDQSAKGSRIIIGQEFDWTQFKDRLDLGRAAVVGHSFGGAAAIATTAVSSDFACAVALDPWMAPIHQDSYTKMTLPIFCINSHTWQWKENLEKMKKIESNEIDRPIVTVRDSCHHAVDDFQYLVSGYLGRKMNFITQLDPVLAGEINAQLSVAFLKKHLGLIDHDPMPGLLNHYQQSLMQTPGLSFPLSEEDSNLRSNL